MNTQAERKFLHDIATPISVAKILINIISEDLNESEPAIEDIRGRLAKVAEALEKLSSLHATHKAEIYKVEREAA